MKNEFLLDQAIANAISSAFQRGRVYIQGLEANDSRKVALREALAKQLKSLSTIYINAVAEELHCQNIVILADSLTLQFKNSGILRDDRFRIGIAQKALNLYLKYLWCLGYIPAPPHCPIDRRIIDKLNLSRSERTNIDWTKLDDIEKYKSLIHKCRKKAENVSIAEWELKEWKL